MQKGFAHTNASILCLEDPMYYAFDTCKLGWFYGTCDEDYREHCASLIRKLVHILNIQIEDVVLYGSSGGGTVAIGVAKYLSGCYVVGINPQLDFSAYPYTQEFCELVGVDLIGGEDRYGRHDNALLIKNNVQSTFLILVNVQSKSDFKEQLRYLCDKLDIEPVYGIKRTGNIVTWLYDAVGAPSEHNSFENVTLWKTIDFLVHCMQDGEDIAKLEGLYRLFNEFWYERYMLLRDNYKLKEEYKKHECNSTRKLKRYREIISYLFWGVMTTIVSWVSYSICTLLFSDSVQAMHVFGKEMSMVVLLSNILSWICAVALAFVVNKLWVFQSKNWKVNIWLSELWKFLSARIVTGVIEIIAVPVLVGTGLSQTIFGIEGMVAKVVVSIVVVVLNYVFSKLFIFK